MRARQYFYANTKLAGYPFEYLGDPIAILKGNLIVGAGFILYTLTQRVYTELSWVGLGLFALVYPFLVYQSLRFLAANSAWRGLRFRFHGTLGESYKIYLLWPLLALPTLGLILPYILFRHRHYLFANAAYGTTRNEFRATSGQFYVIYLLAGLMGLGLYMAFGAVIAVLAMGGMGRGGAAGLGVFLAFIPAYALLLLGLTAIQQYVYARTVNLCWAESSFGRIKFVSTLRSWDLIKLRVVNLLAMIFSLGLLIPWVKVRTAG